MITQTLSPHVKMTTLSSGLIVVTDSMPEAYSVAVGVYVNAGTRNEKPHEQGISHMLEHMAFKGTTTRTPHQIAASMDAVGGHLNAYTTRETTAYYTKVMPKAVPLATEILGDILQNSLFLDAEIEKEKAVIIQEIAQTQDDPADLIFDLFQETAYPDHPMGWSILGTIDSVNALTRDDLINYMQQHYAAENVIVAASGNITHDVFLNEVQTHFSSYSAADTPGLQCAHYKGGITKVNKQLEQLHFVLGFEGAHSTAENFYVQSLYSTLLGGGMSSRLFHSIREQHGLAYSIYSFTSPYQDTGLFGIYGGTGEDEMKQLLPLLTDELIKSTTAITEEELNRAQDQLIANIYMARENTSLRVEQLAQNIQLFGKYITTHEIENEIKAITCEEVKALATKIISSPPTFTAIGSSDDEQAFHQIKDLLRH